MRNNFKLGPVVQEEKSFKRFLIWSSSVPYVTWSGTIYAIYIEGIMGNLHRKLFQIWTSSEAGDVV